MPTAIPHEFVMLSKKPDLSALCNALFEHEPHWHWQKRTAKEKRIRTELTTFVAQHVLERGSVQQITDLLDVRSDLDEMTDDTVRALASRLLELGTPAKIRKWLETTLLESDYHWHEGRRRWMFCLIEQALEKGGRWPSTVLTALFVFARPRGGFTERQSRLLQRLFKAGARE